MKMDSGTLQGKIGDDEAESYIRIQHALLELFAQKSSKKEYLDKVIELLCDWSGCRGGGIRVADEYGNIPYNICLGFSPAFLASESHLSIRRDQCVCIRVVLGKFEPQDFSMLTPGGSFYCNDTFRYLEGLSEEERESLRLVYAKLGIPVDKLLGQPASIDALARELVVLARVRPSVGCHTFFRHPCARFGWAKVSAFDGSLNAHTFLGHVLRPEHRQT